MATSIPAVENATNIQSVLFINVGPIEGSVYYVADTYKDYTVNGNVYTGVGSLVGLTDISDEVRISSGDVGITLSGIPTDEDWIDIILNSKIKGAPVEIFRGFLDADGDLTPSATVYRRFEGIINNYGITENVEQLSQERFHSVTLFCSNINSILEKKISGRKTNKEGMREYFPNDGSWDRVATLMSTDRKSVV